MTNRTQESDLQAPKPRSLRELLVLIDRFGGRHLRLVRLQQVTCFVLLLLSQTHGVFRDLQRARPHSQA